MSASGNELVDVGAAEALGTATVRNPSREPFLVMSRSKVWRGALLCIQRIIQSILRG
jgi:hypothetical protein